MQGDFATEITHYMRDAHPAFFLRCMSKWPVSEAAIVVRLLG